MIVFIIVFACMPRNNMDSEQIFAFIEIGLIVLGITYVVIILLGWIVRSAARTYESLCKKNIVKRYTIFLFIPLANFANIPIYFAI
jgi:hypothetical protein